MGVDLALMPILGSGLWYCHEILECERDRGLWVVIKELGELPVGKEVWCYKATCADGESCYGPVLVTPYDTPLTWLPAGVLADAMISYDALWLGWKHKAVTAYLAAMPREWPVVLYWN